MHDPSKKNVLIACEESQIECKAFLELGFNAFSCDLQKCSGGMPERHIHHDVLSILDGGLFLTQDNKVHCVDKWDLIIAHPPCTYLTKAGAQLLYTKNGLNQERYKKGISAREFFFIFYSINDTPILIENPTPLSIYGLPMPTQVIQPYYFGDPYTKRTCLWLNGLPPLVYTNIVLPKASFTMLHGTGKSRSKSFPGMSKAIAEQYGSYILGTYNYPVQMEIDI